MTNTYTTNSPRAGIEQHTYSTGYKLSIGMSETHYSDGETLAEIAVINPEGNFVHLMMWWGGCLSSESKSSKIS